MDIELTARIIFGSCALLLFGVILYLVRRGLIKEKHSLLWVPLGSGFFLIGVFPSLLVWISELVHLHYITVVLLFVILTFTFILLYITIKLTQLREDIQKLAQRQTLFDVKSQRK